MHEIHEEQPRKRDARSKPGARTSHPSEERASMGTDYARYAGVGLQFGATILLFAYGGYRLDLWLDSSPWFLLAGVFAGFFAGLLSLVSNIKTVSVRTPVDSARSASPARNGDGDRHEEQAARKRSAAFDEEQNESR